MSGLNNPCNKTFPSKNRIPAKTNPKVHSHFLLPLLILNKKIKMNKSNRTKEYWHLRRANCFISIYLRLQNKSFKL